MKLKFTLDWLTICFVMVAYSLILYFKTYYGNTVSVDLPESLLLVGFSIYFIMGFATKRDDTTSEKELNTTLFYAAIAIGIFIVISSTIPRIFDPLQSLSLTELSPTEEFMYGQLYAVSEEVFFRGAFTAFIFYPINRYMKTIDLKIVKVPSELFASVISGSAFAAYHLARYGVGEALVYVLLTGITMSAIVLYSFKKQGELRIGSTIIAHSFNNGYNFLASLLGGIV